MRAFEQLDSLDLGNIWTPGARWIRGRHGGRRGGGLRHDGQTSGLLAASIRSRPLTTSAAARYPPQIFRAGPRRSHAEAGAGELVSSAIVGQIEEAALQRRRRPSGESCRGRDGRPPCEARDRAPAIAGRSRPGRAGKQMARQCSTVAGAIHRKELTHVCPRRGLRSLGALEDDEVTTSSTARKSEATGARLRGLDDDGGRDCRRNT